MTDPTPRDLREFREFCSNATDRQLPNIRDKERRAGRDAYADIADNEMRRRDLG